MPKGKQIQPDDRCKASPEQREKWRQYKAKAREKRAAGIPARQYHKKEVQKMTTISECCETKQPELISTLVEDAVKQAAIPPETTKCIQNEYIVPSESVADLEAYPLVDWRKAKDYTDYRKMLEAANYAYNYYRKWLTYGNKDYTDYELRLLQLFKEVV